MQKLRQSMEETSELFAVAYLGYVEEGDRQDIDGWIRENCPILWGDYPFLTRIPEERTVGKGPAELYCIIPGNSEISVEIVHMELNQEKGIMEQDACLYQSDSTEPFLVLCNGEWEGQNKTQILFQDVSGTQTIWYPMMGEDGQVMIPMTEEQSFLAKDITQYAELGPERYYDWYGGPWTLVTEEQLENTSWQIWINVNQDLSAQYSIDFYSGGQMRLEWFYIDSDTQTEGFLTAEAEYTGSWKLNTGQKKTVLQMDTVQSGGRWYLEGKDIPDWRFHGNLYLSEDAQMMLLHAGEEEELSLPGNDAGTGTVLMFRVSG